MIVLAQSGRALAQMAARAGFVPLVIDLFGDVDTRAVALACEVVPMLDRRHIEPALRRLHAVRRARRIIVGGGLEHDPATADWLASRCRGLQAFAGAVRHLADPARLLRLARRLDLPLPESRLDRPDDPRGWLIKRAGGCGGIDVRRCRRADEPVTGTDYFQREVAGAPHSLTFIAHAATSPRSRPDVEVLGFNRLLTESRGTTPWTYAGAVTRDTPPASVACAVVGAARRISAALGLRGLAGIDFIVDGSRWWLVDINPRPTATAILYDRRGSALFTRHWCALTARPAPPASRAGDPGRRGDRIVYADGPIEVCARGAAPRWLHDRPAAGTTIAAGQPVCTVSATDAAGVLRVGTRLAERAAMAVSWLRIDDKNHRAGGTSP